MMAGAHISKSKNRHVIASIKLLTAAAPLGFWLREPMRTSGNNAHES